MAHLIAYAQMSNTDNSIAGSLAKAQCDLCGCTFGSLEEAKQCERKHITLAIQDVVKSREWVELLRIMREIIEGEGQNES